MFSTEERQELLRFARQTLEHDLGGGPAPAPPALAHPDRHAGAFVSLHVKGELRGCIGYPGSRGRLDAVVARCAMAAATEDPRFPSLTAAELSDLAIEISVLTPIAPIASPAEIEVGRDGLVVEMGFRKGLLLPQVATEYGWDRETFLAHTCLKAGLPADAWKSGAKVSRFQAEVFSEQEQH